MGQLDRTDQVPASHPHREGDSQKPQTRWYEIGKGAANYTGLFAEIKKSGWSGVMAIETDSKAFAEDPNRLVSEAGAFFASQVADK